MDDATQKLVDEARETMRRQEWMPASLVIRLADALEAAQQPPVAEPDNHHNADVCPFCTRNRDEREAAIRAEAIAQRPPVSENVRDLVDDLRESAAQSYEELSQATIDVLNRAADYISRPPVSPEVAEALPVVAHKGPHDTDESMFLTAADNLDRGYPLGGGNLTRAVVELIRREVKRAHFSVPSQPVYDEEAIARWLFGLRYHSMHWLDAKEPERAEYRRDAAALVAALRGGELTREETNRG